MKLAVLAAITGFAVAGIANAEGYDPIETRQAGQDLVSADFAGIRAVVNAKGDVKSVANPAKAIARWIRQFPTQFPKGSEQGHNTRARPEIWTNFADFQQPILLPLHLIRAPGQALLKGIETYGGWLRSGARDTAGPQDRLTLNLRAEPK